MKNDRRVSYTKMVLKQSLLELIKTKPVSKITVKEICENADINRATFYAHFTDVADMLSQIENTLYGEIQASLEKGWTGSSMTELLIEVCAVIYRNGALCRALLSENGDGDFLSRVLNIAREKSLADWKAASPSANMQELENVYTFFAHGSAAVVLSWVQRGMTEPPEAIARFIEQITNRGLGLLEPVLAKRP